MRLPRLETNVNLAPAAVTLQRDAPAGTFGEALSAGLGAAAQLAGRVADKQAEDHWASVAQDYANQFGATANEAKDKGLALTGRDALGYTGKTLAELQRLVETNAKQIPHDGARELFEAMARRRLAAFEEQLGAHERAQDRVYQQGSARGRQALAIADGKRATTYEDVDSALTDGLAGVALELRGQHPDLLKARQAEYTAQFHAEQLAGRAKDPAAVLGYLERYGAAIDGDVAARFRDPAQVDQREAQAVTLADSIYASVKDRRKATEQIRGITDGKLRDLVQARVERMWADDVANAAAASAGALRTIYQRYRATGRLTLGEEGKDLSPEARDWLDTQVYQDEQRRRARLTDDPAVKRLIQLQETAAYARVLRALRDRPELLTDPTVDLVGAFGAELSDDDLRSVLRMQLEAQTNPEKAPKSLVDDRTALLEAAEANGVVPHGKDAKDWSDTQTAGFRAMRDEFDAWRLGNANATTKDRKVALDETALRAKLRAGTLRVPLDQIRPDVAEQIRQTLIAEARTQRGTSVTDKDVVGRYAKWRSGQDPALDALLGPPATRLGPVVVPGEEVVVRAKGGPVEPMTAEEERALREIWKSKPRRTAEPTRADLEAALPAYRATHQRPAR